MNGDKEWVEPHIRRNANGSTSNVKGHYRTTNKKGHGNPYRNGYRNFKYEEYHNNTYKVEKVSKPTKVIKHEEKSVLLIILVVIISLILFYLFVLLVDKYPVAAISLVTIIISCVSAWRD